MGGFRSTSIEGGEPPVSLRPAGEPGVAPTVGAEGGELGNAALAGRRTPQPSWAIAGTR